MKILGLPGVKSATLAWLQQLLSALAEPSASTRIQEYRHWADDSGADLQHEAGRLEAVAVDLVIAKSLGTLIATRAFDSFAFRPKRAVLIGCPLQRHADNHYALLKKFAGAVPTLFIQQTADFNASFDALNQVAVSLPKARTAEVAGDDHVYSDINELSQIIRPFVDDAES